MSGTQQLESTAPVKMPVAWPSMARAETMGKKWRGCAWIGQRTPENSVPSDLLVANEDRLTITCGVGEFNFRPGKVLRIERAGLFPWFWRGIVIEHRMPSYPLHIGFLPAEESTRELLQQLERYGYWVP